MSPSEGPVEASSSVLVIGTYIGPKNEYATIGRLTRIHSHSSWRQLTGRSHSSWDGGSGRVRYPCHDTPEPASSHPENQKEKNDLVRRLADSADCDRHVARS